MTRFFLMAAVALGLVACNKDEAPKSSTDGEGNVWASFNITLPSTGDFRAGVDGKKAGETYEGTAKEQQVTNVRIVLYDGDIAAYTLDYPITADGTGNFTGTGLADGKPATKSKFVTKAEKVVKKNYKALVLLNATAEILTATSRGNNLAEFEKVVTTTPEDLMKSGYIFMSNSQGLVPVTEGQLKDTKTEAEGAPVPVKVDRAVAKVFVGGTPTVKHGAKFQDIKWTLDVTNKKTYWMRKLANRVKSKDIFEAEAIGDNSNRYDRYAEDPNFSGENTHPISENDFNYLTGILEDGKLTEAGFDDAKGIYVLENTMDAKGQFNSVTTRVILRGIYIPENFEENDVKTNGWYSYKGFKMTKKAFDEFKAKVGDGSQEVIGTPAGFAKDIKQLIDGGQNFTEKSFNKNNLKFYKGGVCYYYNIYIRHFSDDQSSKEMGYGRYGIVRNNLYKLTLGTISQPGEPEVVEPDPNVPDDPTERWVSFEVEVLPWLVREQTINL